MKRLTWLALSFSFLLTGFAHAHSLQAEHCEYSNLKPATEDAIDKALQHTILLAAVNAKSFQDPNEVRRRCSDWGTPWRFCGMVNLLTGDNDIYGQIFQRELARLNPQLRAAYPHRNFFWHMKMKKLPYKDENGNYRDYTYGISSVRYAVRGYLTGLICRGEKP